MANLFDYLTWRGDLEFSQVPFNPVDGIIVSQLSYLPLDGIVPSLESEGRISIAQAAQIYTKKFSGKKAGVRGTSMFKEDPDLIKALGDSKRFGDCQLCAYVNNIDIAAEKQFSCLCIITGDGSFFLAFRGTDFTFVGWKEDFNMSFSETVPAQLDAVQHLEKIAGMLKGPIRLGGHSKGGNLAMYAAAFCKKNIRGRIREIYSFDAPGFHRKIITSDGFREIRDRIHAFIPQSSIIGLLLEQGKDYSVIQSSQIGLLQHSLYSWEVIHDDLVRLDSLSQGSRFVDKTIKEWIGKLDYEQRQRFIEALYTILSASHAQSINEFTQDWFKATGRVIQSLGNIDESTRKLIAKTIAALLSSARNNIDTLLKPKSKNNAPKQGNKA